MLLMAVIKDYKTDKSEDNYKDDFDDNHPWWIHTEDNNTVNDNVIVDDHHHHHNDEGLFKTWWNLYWFHFFNTSFFTGDKSSCRCITPCLKKIWMDGQIFHSNFSDREFSNRPAAKEIYMISLNEKRYFNRFFAMIIT